MSKPTAKEVLALLCDTMENTGGVFLDHKGNRCPIIDPEWIDLADAYMQACEVLGREPKIVDNPDSDEIEEDEP